MEIFPIRLKELRMRDNLTQNELAKKLGLAYSTISMYERGERNPDFETLETIADFFNVDMNYLLGKENTSQDPDVYRIQRARNRMNQEEREHMMEVLKTVYNKYFLDDDFVDEDIDE